ncbi:peptidase [Paenibacillus xylanexedens]|uniref:peptidase n=1 Tax=Paenibacillus xylanexedens TaxID=528191 RepID=UPI001F35171B|nr:peptidase [Paenibacillus xylanexedens]MCF7754454.1 peptidase [Paenibacillus xylanexedens]
MNKRKTKKVSMVMICILSLFLASSTVLANTASSPYSTPKIKGHTYTFTSEVWTRNFTTGTTAEAVASVKASASVPNGYMGAMARLYTSGGSLKASSSMTYNTSKISSFFVYSPRITTKTTYYAQNVGEFYNGNGYTRYTGYKSPNLKLSNVNSSNVLFENNTETSETIHELLLQTKYDVNSQGDTYGSALSEPIIGVEPDLIAAIGTNGIEGYLKAEDLTPKITTIEEALAQSQVNGTVRTIHLYDVEGDNIIGEFDVVTDYKVE